MNFGHDAGISLIVDGVFVKHWGKERHRRIRHAIGLRARDADARPKGPRGRETRGGRGVSAAVLQTYPLPADPDLPPRSYGRSPIVAGMAKTFELHVSGCFPRASSSRMRALAAASSFRSASIVAAAACHAARLRRMYSRTRKPHVTRPCRILVAGQFTWRRRDLRQELPSLCHPAYSGHHLRRQEIAANFIPALAARPGNPANYSDCPSRLNTRVP